jgi:transcriptional regulator with XRE-family HTH domain
MDDRRVGLVIGALRRRRGWRQLDLAARAHLSQTTISVVERGHLDSLSLANLRRILAPLDGRGDFDIRWRGGNLDRTLDERHAQLVETVIGWLTRNGWRTEVEVTYAIYGERGSIDVLAFHPSTGSLLVIEVKTEITSIEETLRRHDEKVRLGPRIARDRFDWHASSTSRILVIAEHRSARRHVVAYRVVLDSVMPYENIAVRRWLASPVGSIRGRWFLPYSRLGGIRREPGGPDRVRTARPPADDRDRAQTDREEPGVDC